MYCVYGVPGSSLLLESTDLMILVSIIKVRPTLYYSEYYCERSETSESYAVSVLAYLFIFIFLYTV